MNWLRKMKLRKQLNRALKNIEAEMLWVISYKQGEKEKVANIYSKTPNEAISLLKEKVNDPDIEVVSCLAV